MKAVAIAVAVVVSTVLGGGSGLCATPRIRCADIAAIKFGPGVVVESATLVPAADGLPEHCKISGYRKPDDGFVLKLPTVWNERLYQIGNGGASGSIYEDLMVMGVRRGFATASGSGGHRAPAAGYQFGYGWRDDPSVLLKVEDYFFGSVHKTNALARRAIKAYYGTAPLYAYFNAYSTGGRQALVEAQWYPNDFDGVMGGDGPIPFTKVCMAITWQATQLLGDAYVPIGKLSILADAVMNKCDAIDGLRDGLIDDPRTCDFNARTDLPACSGDVDAAACFTSAQRNAIYRLYDGVRDSAGTLLHKGVNYGSETAEAPHPFNAAGASNWTNFVPTQPGGDSFALGLGAGFVRWIGLPPEKGGPSWDWKTFNVDADWATVAGEWGASSDAFDPKLLPFKKKGGKVIYYHGWAEALVWGDQAPDYYELVVKEIGSLKETQKFFKLYMIPGMTHFAGRGVFDRTTLQEPLFAALVEWVEEGVEPRAIIGSRAAVPNRWNAITRPVCPYPEVARHSGKGSADDAANFMCVPPIAVRFEPRTLDQEGTREFTVHVTVPEGYSIRDWNIGKLSVHGASAVRGTTSGNSYVATFRTQDLRGVETRDAVTLTVTGTFARNGQQALIRANDTVRVTRTGRGSTRSSR